MVAPRKKSKCCPCLVIRRINSKSAVHVSTLHDVTVQKLQGSRAIHFCPLCLLSLNEPLFKMQVAFFWLCTRLTNLLAELKQYSLHNVALTLLCPSINIRVRHMQRTSKNIFGQRKRLHHLLMRQTQDLSHACF